MTSRRGSSHVINPGAMPRRHRRWLGAGILLALFGLVAAGTFITGWQLLLRTGRTPAELLDHIDRRLEGHPTAQALGRPFLEGLRQALHAPSMRDRMDTPFLIPAAPPRRGPADIPAPEPVAPGTKVWKVGGGGALLRIADAAQLAGDGDVVEIAAGDYHGDVTVWPQKRLTIRGVGGAARLHADGQSAEGKAIWVIRQGEFDIANIDFIGAKVEDGNGAGIRLEGGRLRLKHCLFWGNQMGLVTAGLPYAPNTSVEIEQSEFAYSHVPGRWGHNLYIGAIDRLSVTGSYFHHAYRGHLLKSRAADNEILYSRFTDESGGRASYELDFPNGGRVLLLGNIVQQQQDTENGVMIAFGEEGYTWPANSLAMGHNTLVNDLRLGGAFLHVARGADRVTAGNNLLVGFGRYLVSDPIESQHDAHAEWEDLALPARQDYRVAGRDDRLRAAPAIDPKLVPRQQYVHPRRLQPLGAPPSWVGADQRPPG
jgi:hypothetical protein